MGPALRANSLALRLGRLLSLHETWQGSDWLSLPLACKDLVAELHPAATRERDAHPAGAAAA